MKPASFITVFIAETTKPSSETTKPSSHVIKDNSHTSISVSAQKRLKYLQVGSFFNFRYTFACRLGVEYEDICENATNKKINSLLSLKNVSTGHMRLSERY